MRQSSLGEMRGDLLRRVDVALDVAGRALREAAHDRGSATGAALDAVVGEAATRPLEIGKVVAEAAMLARCVARISSNDEVIAARLEELVARSAPLARDIPLLATLCREPARALDAAAAHIHLGAVDGGDPRVDRLLAAALACDADAGERLPNHSLERHWLRETWAGAPRDIVSRAALVERTCLARPLDVHGASTADLYALTHVVLYATDMGRDDIVMPRDPREIMRDTGAAVAAALDADNLDLTAELLWTFPMLGLPWPATARFAFELVGGVEDDLGFVPGPEFSPSVFAGLGTEAAELYCLRTSYHATLVMGILCASILQVGAMPAMVAPVCAGPDDVGALLALLRPRTVEPRWRRLVDRHSGAARAELVVLVLEVALRRAVIADDVDRVRRCLEVAGAAVAGASGARTALTFVQRAALLSELVAA